MNNEIYNLRREYSKLLSYATNLQDSLSKHRKFISEIEEDIFSMGSGDIVVSCQKFLSENDENTVDFYQIPDKPEDL